ncbi:MAG: hypothetical protein E7Z87_02185 [Cyanobacteria bacterium SIG26]|nr:hypothetical protein [Cyanobacteria bacterium SIG26]
MRITSITPTNNNPSFGQIKLGSHPPIDFVLKNVAKKNDYIKLQKLIEQENYNDCDVLLTHIEKVDEEIIDEDLLSGKPFKYLRNCKLVAIVGNQKFTQTLFETPMHIIEEACNYAQKVKNEPLLKHRHRNHLTKENKGFFKRQTDNFKTVIELLTTSEPDKNRGRFSEDIREGLAKMADTSY